MKKLLFLALALPAAGAVHAQEPNSILLYGSGYYSGGNNHAVSAGLGYQFNKHWTVGGLFSETYSNQRFSMPPSLYKSYSLGAFARYSSYFGDSKRFFWYGQASFYRFSMNGTSFDPTFTMHESRIGYQAKLAGGLGVNVWRGFSVNVEPGSVSLSSGKFNFGGGWTQPSERTGTLEFGIRPQIIFSKNFKIGGHKKAEKPKLD